MAGLVADRNLYITQDRGKVVEAGDVKAAFLFCTPGYVIPQDQCAAYGLSHDADGRLLLPEQKQAKQVANKMRFKAESKAESKSDESEQKAKR